MKEYLVRDRQTGFHYLEKNPARYDLVIEIPDGADILAKADDGITTFWGKEYQWEINGEICRNIKSEDPEFTFKEWKKKWNAEILWQRHTQPEELPFVDDGPMTEDDFKKQRSDNVNIKVSEVSESLKKSAEDIIKKQSERFTKKVVGKDSKLGNFVVDDTLSQRQSQYGDFHNVAHTTQYLLQMLSNDKMSDVQLESLHMICSKLARITHGDPNHVDSWHDIAGYATLVVKDIS